MDSRTTGIEHVLDVIVVGGGIMGSCTAYQTSMRGYSTLLLDQFDFLHNRRLNRRLDIGSFTLLISLTSVKPMIALFRLSFVAVSPTQLIFGCLTTTKSLRSSLEG